MSYNAFVQLAKNLLAQQRFFEAHWNFKKAGDELLKLYYSAKIGKQRAAYMHELLNNRRLTEQMEMHIDFDRYKANADAKILEAIRVPEDECIGECSSIFRKYCNDNVLEVIVYESDICSPTHFRALRYLLCTLQKLCHNLRFFKLKCKKNRHCAELQAQQLQKFQKNLWSDWGVHFEYEIVQQRCFHQPKIVFNTGIVFYFDAGFKFFVYADDPNSDRCRGLERRIVIWQTNIWPNENCQLSQF